MSKGNTGSPDQTARRRMRGALEGPVRRGLRRPPRGGSPMRADPRRCTMPRCGRPVPGDLKVFPNMRAIFQLSAQASTALWRTKSLAPKLPLGARRRARSDTTADRICRTCTLSTTARNSIWGQSPAREALERHIQWAASAVTSADGAENDRRDEADVCVASLPRRGGSRSPRTTKRRRMLPWRRREDACLGVTDIIVSLLPLTPGNARHPQPRRLHKAQPQGPVRRARR